jgi:rhodanese-related sulfurtransferase
MSRPGAAPSGGRSFARSALLREAGAIVLTGIAVGLAFNYIGLSSRPSRGLPWIARAVRLDSAESLAVAARAPAPPAPAAPVPLAPAAPAKARSGAPPKAPPARAARHASPLAGGASPARASTLDPAPTPAVPPAPAAAAANVSQAQARPAGADSTNDLPAIPEAERPLKVSLATVSRFVKAGAALVVDAREAEEFAAGHIPGAVNVPYDDAVRDPAPLSKLDTAGRPIIVYCSGGTCESSRLLAEMLVRDLGQRRVLVYEGGFPEWAASGEPVSRESR